MRFQSGFVSSNTKISQYIFSTKKYLFVKLKERQKNGSPRHNKFNISVDCSLEGSFLVIHVELQQTNVYFV